MPWLLCELALSSMAANRAFPQQMLLKSSHHIVVL